MEALQAGLYAFLVLHVAIVMHGRSHESAAQEILVAEPLGHCLSALEQDFAGCVEARDAQRDPYARQQPPAIVAIALA